MFTTKSRIAALLVLTILILSAGRICIPRGAYCEAAPTPVPLKVPKEMLERRLEAAKAVWQMKGQEMQFAKGKLSDFFGWSERLLDAELALADKKEDRVKALQAHVDRTRKIEAITTAHAKAARGSPTDAHLATYERLNAEIRCFEATGKIPPPSPKEKDNLPNPKKKP